MHDLFEAADPRMTSRSFDNAEEVEKALAADTYWATERTRDCVFSMKSINFIRRPSTRRSGKRILSDNVQQLHWYRLRKLKQQELCAALAYALDV